MSFKNEINKLNKSRKPNKMLLIGYAVVAVICVTVMIALGAFGRKNNNNDSSSLGVISEISIVSSNIAKTEISSNLTEISSVISGISSKSSSISSVKSPVASVNTSSRLEENITAYIPNGDWRLIIANKQHPMPKSYVVNTAYISGNYRIDNRVKDAYNQMISAAQNDGISLRIISGFRTFSGQESLFNNKVNQYVNQGYSRDKAKELAAQYVAPPGTSEHLTGLAVDLISPDWYNYNSSLTADFEKTPQFNWLYNNCAEYGFILRYPKDKVGITGYSYEPWHYRYVGVEAAKEIMSKKICLEEYVAAL